MCDTQFARTSSSLRYLHECSRNKIWTNGKMNIKQMVTINLLESVQQKKLEAPVVANEHTHTHSQ